MGHEVGHRLWTTRLGVLPPCSSSLPCRDHACSPKAEGRGHVIIAVPKCELSSLLKNHAICPGGSISPIVHSHDPKWSPFPLGSSHSRFPCSQKMSLPYTSHAFSGASTDFPSLILITPLSPPPLLSKEGVALPTL